MIEIPDGNWWDWEVVGWDGRGLVLGADYDLSYHHGLEVIFTDPAYVQCPAYFHDPVFREPTEEEWKYAARQVGEPVPVLVAFEADVNRSVPASCLIAAEKVEVVVGTVLRSAR